MLAVLTAFIRTVLATALLGRLRCWLFALLAFTLLAFAVMSFALMKHLEPCRITGHNFVFFESQCHHSSRYTLCLCRYSVSSYRIASRVYIAMADALEQNFEGGEGASSGATSKRQCSSLGPGDYVMIKERPCKIVEISTSTTGKHGHSKTHIVALDMFTGKKMEDIVPSTHDMNVPDVLRTDFQVMRIRCIP